MREPRPPHQFYLLVYLLLALTFLFSVSAANLLARFL